MTVTSLDGPLDVHKVAGSLGARIDGLLLSGDLADPVIAAIRAALLAHRVVFLRRQQHLDDAEQTAFARRLGPVTTAHPTVPAVQGSVHVLGLDSGYRSGRANNWHTDVTFVDQPPAVSILRAVVIPEFGGDTVWANTVAAYELLPPPLRTLADQLWAIHTNAFDYARLAVASPQIDPERIAAYAAVFASTKYETRHPVVRLHPETGERSLLLGAFARQLEGIATTDSAALLTVLQQHVTRLENTVRWQWQAGDVAIWDNRSTQHYAINDYDQPRSMRRVTLAGEVPVSLSGETSRSLLGDAAAYYEAAA